MSIISTNIPPLQAVLMSDPKKLLTIDGGGFLPVP